ncbi:DNA double-strand break repair nuclease NurA [Thermococcus sp.]|uniref:DNA double-strand break repair nuclease NurA n=1 Tax=Thermococcus sp. TaxID=35749 RepID=UPI0025E80BED|nr:DNA double-strand break repair nuclease NurA [Thermococcus sp.]
MAVNNESPLDFLPEAMVDDMISQYSTTVFPAVDSYLKHLQKLKGKMRHALEQKELLKSSGDILEYRGIDPTVCGVDGAYAISRQIAVDVVGIAAVAVEGLPPYEKRLWKQPHHISKIVPVEHKADTPTIAGGLMFSYELELASNAPHNVVLIDGSLTTHLIKIGMTFSKLDSEEVPISLNDEFKRRAEQTLRNYLKVITSPKGDQVFAGVPKYSSRDEIITFLSSEHEELFKDIQGKYNDKALLSVIMKSEEIVGPIPLVKRQEEGKWHISGKGKIKEIVGANIAEEYYRKIISALDNLYVVYYKPSSSQPALRVEIPKSVARNPARLAMAIKALQDQAKFPGIIEPYPLYLADLFVKHLGGALSQVKDIVLSDLAVMEDVDPISVLLSMHEYRSVGGYD